MNTNILAVDTSSFTVYDFLKDDETKENLLERANNRKQEDIDTWSSHCENYPDKDIFKSFLKQAQKKNHCVMSWEEYEQLQRNFYIEQPLQEVDEDRYYEMLNVLPPKCWTTINGVEMFCMSEMLTGVYTSQYAKVNNKYYSKIVDIFDKATWINNYL